MLLIFAAFFYIERKIKREKEIKKEPISANIYIYIYIIEEGVERD